MKTPVNVLIVEDSEDDAQLVLDELRRSGYAPVFERVETAPALTAALQRQAWDVVIADYRMPDFSGPAALKLVKASGLDLPFIVVSGTVGEDLAVEMLKAGANDYLLKDRLGRLGTAVAHELESNRLRQEARRTMEELRIEEQHARSLLKLARQLERALTQADIFKATREVVEPALGFRVMWLYVLAADGKHLKLIASDDGTGARDWPGEGERLLIAGDPMLEEIAAAKELVVVEDARTDPRTNKAIVEKLGNRTIVNMPIVLAGKNLGCIGAGTFGGEGIRKLTPAERDFFAALASHLAVVLDRVTAFGERKRAEDELQAAHAQLRQLLEHSPAVIYALKVAGQNLVPYLVSENITELLGFTVPESLHYEWWLGQLHPEDRDRTVASLAETMTRGASATEYRLRHHDGSYRWVEDKRRLIRDSSRHPKEIVGVWADITERKRAEEILRGGAMEESDQRKMTIRRELFVLLGLAGVAFALSYHFSLFEEVFAFIADEKKFPLGDELFGALLFLGLGLMVFSYRRWQESAGDTTSQRHIAEALRVLHDELDRQVRQQTAELSRTNEALRAEIAERQRAEAALTAAEAKFRQLVEQSLTGIYIIQEDRFAYVNPKLADLLGRSAAEITAVPMLDFVHEADRSLVQENVLKRLTNVTSSAHYTLRMLHRSGRVLEAEVLGGRTEYNGRPAILGTLLDITERRQAEQALSESERRFREMLENVELIALTLDLNGKVTFANDYMLRLTGWRREEVLGADYFSKFIPGTDETVMKQVFDTLKEGALPPHYENPIRTRAGERREIVWNNTILRDAAGNITGLASLGEDVTERKRAGEELRRTADLLNAVAAGTTDAVFVKDSAGRYLLFNEAAARFVGRPAAEAIGQDDTALFDPESAKQVMANDRAVRDSGLTHTKEERLTAAGVTRTYLATKAPYRDGQGNITGTIGISRDISERKQAEESLAQRAAHAALGADIGVALTRKGLLPDVLRHCAEAMVKHLDAAFARIWVLKELEPVLELQASAGMYVHLDGPHGRVPVGKFKIGQIAQERKPHLTNSVVGDPRVSDQAWASREGMVAFAGYPLLVEDRLVGVVALFARHPLAEATLAALGSVADGIALGIERKLSEDTVRVQLGELLRWQHVMVNREDRVQQLKTEVNEQLVKQGEPPRYARPSQP